MDAHAAAATVATDATPWKAYLQEARYEFLRLWRSPSFSLPVLLFPPLFYLLFGEIFGGNRDPEAARYLLAGYSVFGIMGVALFGFGVTVALDREQGLLLLKRAQPMPPGAYLLAKVAMAMLFGAIVVVLLAVLGAAVAGVRLAPVQWLGLAATCLLGVLPFSALGLWLGTLVGGRGAPALINLVYLPMAFLSGLFIPLAMLPAALKTVAPLWPSYHLARIAQAQVGFGDGGMPWPQVAVLLGVSVLFLFLARRRLATS
ncbi:ABC transporter permease [Pseudoxanthomonas koreensis]|uniref:ABC transporter permease n=1 Tax=Pseudoxanthomonas koreensis TaxID=266061 RepID=UPI001391AA4A|nr:ABC transporter permease [Pseudoxanthomonas koreensis]KAF1694965.1 ABC transporter permease [Pseudoxanthomonas koreensis]